jgi:hypothetical protein
MTASGVERKSVGYTPSMVAGAQAESGGMI